MTCIAWVKSHSALVGTLAMVGAVVIVAITVPLATRDGSDNDDDIVRVRCLDGPSCQETGNCLPNHHVATIGSLYKKNEAFRYCHPNCLQGQHNENTPDGKCIQNTCTCVKGISKNGKDCKVHGEEDCSSCEQGFTLENDLVKSLSDLSPFEICVPIERCSCPNGVAIRDCPDKLSIDNLACLSCDSGYQLVNNECVKQRDDGDDDNPSITSADGPCSYGYHLENGKCEINSCSCFNGFPSETCPVHNTVSCKSCFDGYVLGEKMSCILNNRKKCTCPNGTSAGNNCPIEGLENCIRCDDYYQLENVSTGVNHCRNCKQGYHKIGTECIANNCRCEIGSAENYDSWSTSTDQVCLEHNSESCYKCDEDHFDLVGIVCEAKENTNICVCKNGNEEIGNENCLISGDHQCKSCDEGFHLINIEGKKSCEPNVCECEEGFAENYQNWTTLIDERNVGEICPENFSKLCVRCDNTTHRLNSGKCELLVPLSPTVPENTCVCENGSPVTGADCTSDGAQLCLPGSCETGFHEQASLGNLSCIANECTCEKGFAANFNIWPTNTETGDICLQHQSLNCAKCDEPNFILNTDPLTNLRSCKATGNVCTCENGTGSSGDECAVDGQANCSDCNSGYTKKQSRGKSTCDANDCTCEFNAADGFKNWSTGMDGTNGSICETDGSIACSICANGFVISRIDGSGTASCVADGS